MGDETKQAKDKKADTLGAAYKIFTSKAFERATALVLGGLAIAGISIVALPAAIVGIVTVAIGSVIDTYSLRTTRRLVKEQKLLVQNRNAISKQKVILEKSDKLNDALKSALVKPNRSNQKSVTDRYISENTKTKTNFYDYGKAILKNITNCVFSIGTAVSAGNILSTVIAVGKAGKAIYSEASANNSISAKREEFYRSIDRERDKQDTPGYNNLRELRIAVREQRIQALALEKMFRDDLKGKYSNMSTEAIKQDFENKKLEVEILEGKIRDQRHPVIKAFRSFGKNFLRAHDPFSKYNDLSKLKVREEEAVVLDDIQKLTSKTQHKSIANEPKPSELAKQIKQKVDDVTLNKTATKPINSDRKSRSSTNLSTNCN